MTDYPFWIEIKYIGFDSSKQIGYTGSITKESDLADIIIRLKIELNNIKSLLVNERPYPAERLEKYWRNR